jgi:cytoskeleton protein RodZ
MDELARVGAVLRARREQLGLSLDDVAEATKIRNWYLAALEEDNRARLPADVYALGFLRAYARYLDLDAGDLVARWRSSAPEEPSPPPSPAPRRGGPPIRPHAPPAGPGPSAARHASGARAHRDSAGPGAGVWVAAMLVGVVVVGLVLLLLHRSSAPVATPTRPPAATSPTEPKKGKTKRGTTSHSRGTSRTPSQSKTPSKAQQSSGVTLVSQTGSLTSYRAASGPITLNLSFSAACWVEVWVNGSTSNPYGQVYQPGQTLSVTGSQSVEVRLGHPGGTTIVANGQTLPPLGPGATDVLVSAP